jgi:hypothetical protein
MKLMILDFEHSRGKNTSVDWQQVGRQNTSPEAQ